MIWNGRYLHVLSFKRFPISHCNKPVSGSLHLTYANLVSLFTTFLFCGLWLLTALVVVDLSKECDLKEAKTKRGENTCDNFSNREDIPLLDQLSPIHNNSTEDDTDVKKNVNYTPMESAEHNQSVSPNQDFFRSIISSFDLCMLLCFCFVCSFVLFGLDTMVPLIGSTYFGFDARDVSIIYIIDGVLYGFVLVALAKISTKFADFHIILLAMCVEILGLVSVLCIKLYHTNVYANYVFLCVYVIAFSSAWCIEEVLTRSLFGKLVPSACQSYAEGIRRSTSNVAFIISGVTTAGLFEYLSVTSVVLIGCTVAMMIVFYCRRYTLLNPTPQFSLQTPQTSRGRNGYTSIDQPWSFQFINLLTNEMSSVVVKTITCQLFHIDPR